MEERMNMIYALIIGGSRGLGLATVQKLLSEGIPVIAVHRDRRKLMAEVEATFGRLKKGNTPFYSIHGDAIGQPGKSEILEELRDILGESGKIGFLVHSIAKGNLKYLLPTTGDTRLSVADFTITAEAMAFNMYDWVQTLQREKLLGPDTRIIAFTSEGSTKVTPAYGAVAAAKAALEAIVRQIAVEFAPSGLKANCIQAGVVDTESFRQLPDSEAIMQESLRRNPQGRLTTPEDVANVVYLLTRPEAIWITGTVVKADGGESIC
jgi:enoyl-[acyl-carrier protein] reductase I